MTSATLVELPSLDFVAPFPGFPGQSRVARGCRDESGVLYELRSLDDAGLRFLVVPPAPFFPEYAPELDDITAAALSLTDAEQALLLIVINPGADAAGTTANLLAPIVINTETRQAAQVVLAGADLPVRAPLAAA
jgi:flagellar assembly factor FliW